MLFSKMQIKKNTLKAYNLFNWWTNNEIFFSDSWITFISIKDFGRVKTKTWLSKILQEEGGFKILPHPSAKSYVLSFQTCCFSS